MRVAIAVAMLGVIVVGCDAIAASSGPMSASSTITQATATPTASPSSNRGAIATPLPSSRPTSAAPPPLPSPRPTSAAPPPLPKAVTITRKGCYTGPEGDGVPPGTCTTTLTWKLVPTVGTEIEVYGVTGCLSLTERAGDGSCLVVGTAVPPSTRKLIARVPASNGTVSWTGPAWLDVIDRDMGGPTYQAIGVDRHGNDIYFAIVVTASNGLGHSKFVIADAGSWCYDTGCAGP